MQDNKEIEEIILKSLTGKISPEEKVILKAWRGQSKINKSHYKHLKQFWRTSYQEPKYINSTSLKERIIEGGFSGGNANTGRNRVVELGYMLKIAAILLIALSSAFLVYEFSKHNESGHSEQVGSVLIQKEVQAGQKLTVNLPDGSTVKLNSGSYIRYSSAFDAKERLVELSGEAFFDVERDESRPFIIISSDVRTKVLGTSFNVQAYPEKEISITVASGKVEVLNLNDPSINSTLTRNQRAVFNRDDGAFQVTENIKLDKYLRWKDGIIILDGETMTETVAILNKWYGVNILLDSDNFIGCRIYGTYDNESLENVLQGLEFSLTNFEYEKLNGNEYRITGDSCE